MMSLHFPKVSLHFRVLSLHFPKVSPHFRVIHRLGR